MPRGGTSDDENHVQPRTPSWFYTYALSQGGEKTFVPLWQGGRRALCGRESSWAAAAGSTSPPLGDGPHFQPILIGDSQ